MIFEEDNYQDSRDHHYGEWLYQRGYDVSHYASYIRRKQRIWLTDHVNYIMRDDSELQIVYQWCIQNIKHDWCFYPFFMFEHPEDLMLFRLRFI